MAVVALLLLALALMSGIMSIVFFCLARNEPSHGLRFVVQTTWSGFFQGLFIGLLIATVTTYTEHLAGWR